MKDLQKRIDELQALLKKHRHAGLKELPTRTIFVDPLLGALGWDVRSPDEVELEYPTIDGKAVDYALKIDRKPVIFLEAKALDDTLDDVKAITQVVGYAVNEGVNWCILTNGIRYKVFSSAERATAPNKLLFEISIDSENLSERPIEQMAAHLTRFSRNSMEDGVLDEIGEEIFTTAKVRKAIDKLFAEQDDSFVRLIRKMLDDENVSPAQVKAALPRIWRTESAKSHKADSAASGKQGRQTREKLDYGENHHTGGRPVEVIELYRKLDRFCQDLAPTNVSRRYLAKHVAWTIGKTTFCSVHLLQSGLKMWLNLNPNKIPSSITQVRDVSKVGHWGVGDVEIFIDNAEFLHDTEQYIKMAFDLVSKVES
jgi:predicted type IV restriction endonuclease/predicted transport protein